MLVLKLLLTVYLASIAATELEASNNGDIENVTPRFGTTRDRNIMTRQVAQPQHRVPRPIPRPGFVQRLTTSTAVPITTTDTSLTFPTLTVPLRPGYSQRPRLPSFSNNFVNPTRPFPVLDTHNLIPGYLGSKEKTSTDPISNEVSSTIEPKDLVINIPAISETPTAVSITELPEIISTIQTTQRTPSELLPIAPPLPAIRENIPVNLIVADDPAAIVVPARPTAINPSSTFRYTLPPRYSNKPDSVEVLTPKPVLITPSYTNKLTITPASTPDRDIAVRPNPVSSTPKPSIIPPKLSINIPLSPKRPLGTYPGMLAPFAELYDYSCKPGINAFYPIADDCDSYVECKKNVAVKYICPDGLHYNSKILWPQLPCSYPSEVQCNSNALKQIPQPTNECPHQHGHFPINDGACDSFIICQDGKATIMKCPAGLAYNPVTTSCDWPANVPTCNPHVFNGFECPEPPMDEFGRPSDVIYNYRFGSSCKEYVACQLRRPRLLSCDAGLSFDEEFGACIDSDLVQGCSFLS